MLPNCVSPRVLLSQVELASPEEESVRMWEETKGQDDVDYFALSLTLQIYLDEHHFLKVLIMFPLS